MAAQKRKKTSRAERKAKTQKRQSQQQASVAKPQADNAPTKAKGLSFEQVEKLAGERKKVLHLGCRHPQANRLHEFYKKDDWFEVRLDKNPNAQPHLLTDMTDLSIIPDESVDVVFTSHNLDSLNTADVQNLFDEVRRILKWGGQFVLTVPDLQTICNYVAHDKLMEPIYDSPAGPVTPIDLLYGFRTKVARGDASVRRTGFSASGLLQYFRESSYTNIVISRKWVEIWATAFKYKEGDPRRIENVEMRSSPENEKIQLPAPLPLNRVPHPGQFTADMLSDDLGLPPKYWKPTGIDKK